MKPPTSGWHSSSRSSAVSSCPGMSIISGPSSVLAVVDLLFVELSVGTCGNKIKQLDDIFIAHAHTAMRRRPPQCRDIRRRSEEHTSELQSLMRLSYAVFCLKTKLSHKSSLTQTKD